MSCGWWQCGRRGVRISDVAGRVAGDDGHTWWSLGQCLFFQHHISNPYFSIAVLCLSGLSFFPSPDPLW